MTIRNRIIEAQALFTAEFFEASMILTLVAIAGASRKVYPDTIIKNDGDAFVTYLEEQLGEALTGGPVGPGMTALMVNYKSKDQSISKILYKEYRCSLVHEAELPERVSIDLSLPANGASFSVRGDELALGLGWIPLMWTALIQDRRLSPLFDDLRRSTAEDLVFVGDGTEEAWSEEFIAKHGQSPGRLRLIKDLFAKIHFDLDTRPDDEFFAYWREQVQPEPARFGLHGGRITGLRGPGFQPTTMASWPVHKIFLEQAEVRPTADGVAMLRDIAAAFKLR